MPQHKEIILYCKTGGPRGAQYPATLVGTHGIAGLQWVDLTSLTPTPLNLDVGCSRVAVISFHALWHPSRVCFPVLLPFNSAQSCMKFSQLVQLSLPKSFSCWVFQLLTIQSC